MSSEPSTYLSPKRWRISEPSVDTAQLPCLPYNLPPPPTWILILRSLLLKIKICQQAMKSGTVELQQQSQEQEVKRARHRGQNRVSLHMSPLIREGVVGSYSVFTSKLLLFGFIYFVRKVNPQWP